jgi:hypothetical protein
MAERKTMKQFAYSEQKIAEKFWQKVNVNLTGCWEWNAGTSHSGYGNYRNVNAHRFSYTLTYGSIEKELVVMHKCDNRKCVRPDHLSVGTYKDNSIDMRNKNRNAVFLGEEHGQSVLTESQVRYIRKNYIRGTRWAPGNSDILASQFNISVNHVTALVRGDKWQWLKEKQ